MKRRVTLVGYLMIANVCLADDCKPKTDFGGWLTCKIAERQAVAAQKAEQLKTKARPSALAVAENTRNGTQHEEAPAAASNTTSLVDQTSASDFVSLALNMAKLTTSTAGSNDQNSVTVTTSAYSLYAAANHHDPLDPSFYARNIDWRRLYLTLGRDVPDRTAATSAGTGTQNTGTPMDPHAHGPGTIAGVKFVLWNRRDVTSKSNQKFFDNAVDQLARANVDRAAIERELDEQLAELKLRTLTKFDQVPEDKIDAIIDKHVQSFITLQKVVTEAASNIRHNRQWAIGYYADLRNAQGYNQHRGEMEFDWGLSARVNWTANASLDFWDAKSFGPNRTGGRAATEFQYRITEDLGVAQPFLLSFSGFGEWLTHTAPIYKMQLKLTIPLGQQTGVTLPASVTYASRTDLIQESHTEARFGFSFDAGKLAALLRAKQ